MQLSQPALIRLLGALVLATPLAGQQVPVVRPISAGHSVMSLAEALLRDGRRAEAAELLGKWLSEHPTDGRAWHYLGSIHLADAQRWHRTGHAGEADGGMLLEFAGAAFEQAQHLLADSGTVYRVLVGAERATAYVEAEGWEALLATRFAPEELPLPPVLAELGDNLISSCPANAVMVTGSKVEMAAVWGRWLLDPSRRSDLLLLRPDLYEWDPRYRVRMAEAMGVPLELSLPDALLRASTHRPLCLTPTVDSLTAPALAWRPVRLVLATGAAPAGGDPGEMTVHQLALTGLAGSVWSEAARDVYDLAARRNRDLCRTLLASSDIGPRIPAIASCPRE
jgi:hypothetical protein